jgi:hypothetical protein
VDDVWQEGGRNQTPIIDSIGEVLPNPLKEEDLKKLARGVEGFDFGGRVPKSGAAGAFSWVRAVCGGGARARNAQAAFAGATGTVRVGTVLRLAFHSR